MSESDPRRSSPALSDLVLRETLDLLGEVVATMSVKLDRQSEEIGQMRQLALTTHEAALKSERQSDPQLYARYIGNELEEALGPTVDRLAVLHDAFGDDRDESSRRLRDLESQEERLVQHQRDELDRMHRWRKRIPLLFFAATLLALGLSVALPRFWASHASGCATLGGSWMTETATGKVVCVFREG